MFDTRLSRILLVVIILLANLIVIGYTGVINWLLIFTSLILGGMLIAILCLIFYPVYDWVRKGK